MMFVILWGLLLLLVFLLIGFAVGRRLGYLSGVQEGRALGKIELREQSLRRGACAVCERKP